MNHPSPLPGVDVSVAVILLDGRVLLDWNRRWGSFSLPMTKIRTFPDARGHADPASESPLEAAIRAAAESLGRPLTADEIPGPEPETLELQPYSHRSDRDGQWKRYNRRVFLFPVRSGSARQTGGVCCWVAPDEIGTLRPISPTASEIVEALVHHNRCLV